MYCIPTDFAADSSSRFPFTVRSNRQTDRQTRLNALYSTPAAIQPASVTTKIIYSVNELMQRRRENYSYCATIRNWLIRSYYGK